MKIIVFAHFNIYLKILKDEHRKIIYLFILFLQFIKII